jgi:hypothetical protein
MPEAAAAAAATTPAEKAESKRTQWRNQSTVLVTEKGSTNPKKPNSLSFERYQTLLRMSKQAKGGPIGVAALFKAGYRMDDIRHDSSHGFITLNEPFSL